MLNTYNLYNIALSLGVSRSKVHFWVPGVASLSTDYYVHRPTGRIYTGYAGTMGASPTSSWSSFSLSGASAYTTAKRLAAEAGYTLVSGSFEEGGTVSTTTEALWYQGGGKYYSWSGAFPKVVAAGSTPATSGGIGAGAWVDRTDVTLRSDLSASDGYKLLGEVTNFAALRTLVPTSEGVRVKLRGYYSESTDGGGEFIGHLGTATDDGGSIAAGDGFYWKRDINYNANILMFGAKRDGVFDSAVPFQNAINYAMKLVFGGTVDFPEGKYYISAPGLADRSADPTKSKVSFKGADLHSTLISAPNGFVRLIGSTITAVPEPNASYQSISDMTIYGDGTQNNNVGLGLTLCSFLSLSNLSIEGYGWGIYGLDCDQANFYNIRLRWNFNGFLFNKDIAHVNIYSTQPNNFNWFGCTIANNAISGGLVEGGSSWNFWGGDFENNGTGATSPEGWGFKMVNPGYEGGTGVNFWGVYFESNAWGADVILQNTTAVIPNQVTHGFTGCTFARGTSGHYPIYNILMSTGVRDTVGIMKLNVRGCTFKSAGSYTPNASRPYIHWFGADSANFNTFVQSGNVFEDPIETPDFCIPTAMFCSASRATNLPVAPNTETLWPLDTVHANFGIDVISNGFTIAQAGLYQVSMSVLFNSAGGTDATGGRGVTIKRNGNTAASALTIGTGCATTTVSMYCNAGDTISFYVFHREAANINAVGSNFANSTVHICKVA